MAIQKRVLIVDDEEMIRELLVHALAESDIQTATAENGQVALDLFSKPDARYDLVIVDMSMPGMDGAEVCRAMRTINPAQKIIISSGSYSSDEEIAELQENGITHIIRKPFAISELLSLFQRELCS